MKNRITLLTTLLLSLLLFASCSNESDVVDPSVLVSHPHLYFGKTVQVCGEVFETGIYERPVGGGWYKIQNPRGPEAQVADIVFRTMELPPQGEPFTITGMLSVDSVTGDLIFQENGRSRAAYSHDGWIVPVAALDPMASMLMIIGAILLVGAFILTFMLISSSRSNQAQYRAQTVPPVPVQESHHQSYDAPEPDYQPVRTNGDSPRVQSHSNRTATESETVVVTSEKTKLFGDLAWLSVNNGNNRGAKYDINSDSLRIGRGHRNNEVYFDDDKMSREHAIIRRLNGDYVITDRGSANGTLVNDQKISGDYPLNDGDIITLGETKIVFKQHSN